MSINNVKLSRTAKKLLELVPPDGTFIGNTTLQRRSKLGKSYWKVRNELVSGGFLSRGKGRGGSVARFFEVLVTGTPKRKQRTGGKWSRPDVTLVQVNSYDYLPQTVLEVTTFEVKKFPDAEDIRSVYETASHSRRTHFSYLVAEVPSPDYEFPERFVSELERFHLGLIFMWKEKEKWKFEEQEWETERLTRVG